MNKENILYLSTDHLSPESRELTDADIPDSAGITVEPTEFGLDVNVSVQFVKQNPDMIKSGLPSDLAKAVLFAADIGCSFIRFDSDEPALPYLPRYGDGIAYDITFHIAFDIEKNDGTIVQGHTSRMCFNDCRKWPDFGMIETYFATAKAYAEKELDAKQVMNLRCITREEYEALGGPDPETEIEINDSGVKMTRNGETLYEKQNMKEMRGTK